MFSKILVGLEILSLENLGYFDKAEYFDKSKGIKTRAALKTIMQSIA